MKIAQKLLVASGVALVLLAPRPAAAEDELVLIDSFGVWTLEDLGYKDLSLPVDGPSTEASIRYALLPGASQGPDDWYMIHLHVAVEIADDSGEGFALVSGLTNGGAAAQVKFEADDSQRLTWSSVDLLNGYIDESTTSREVEVRFSNYLPFSGVRTGENVLTFKLEQFRDVKVSSVRVFGDSGIEYTPLSPPELELEPELPDNRVRLGDVFEIGYELNNVGDRPANDVVVGLIYPPEGFTLTGETPHSFPSITGSVAGVFTLKAIREGTHQIVLGAESPSSRPVAEIQAVVYTPGGTFLTKGRLWVAVPLILSSALVIAVVGRRLIDSSHVRKGP